ncbi:MAG: hypothetical protein JXR37_21955 [Kiritimatiellae bacterium]|nr:hypothetical protein [Kiritimatiellia bacterium]
MATAVKSVQIEPIVGEDRSYLRDLACRVAEAANRPEQAERASLWRRHNGLERVRPLVLVFPEGAWRELWAQEPPMRTRGNRARQIERDLRVRLYYAEHLRDDNVIEPVLASPIVTHQTGWGLEPRKTKPATPHGAAHFEPVLLDDADADKLTLPEVTVDWAATEALHAQTCELLGDILAIEKQGPCRGGFAPLDHYLQLRGIDRLFLDLCDRPDLVHRVIGTLTDGQIRIMQALERQGALTLGNRNHYVGSGGTGYTDALPGPDFDGEHVRTKDLWGFATAQIFSEVSPAMHEEFALRHEKRFLDLFGLNCYGCCEPLHLKLDAVLRHVPRLRRLSISPWADVAICAERLGRNCIFSWKPNPAILAGETWDPDAARRQLRAFCEATRGNVVEIVMKDTHTIRGQPHRMWEWVRIAKEVALDY